MSSSSSSTTSQQRRQSSIAPQSRSKASSASVDEEMRQTLSDIRLLESSARILQSRLDLISAALSETLSAIQTLEGNKIAPEGTETLIPIGSGSFVKAKLAEPQKAIIGIGAGVTVEKSVDDSIKDLRVRSSELERARTAITQQLEQVLAQNDNYRARLNALVRKKGGGVEIV